MLQADLPGAVVAGSDPVVLTVPAAMRAMTVIEPRSRLFHIDFRALWEYRELVYFMIWRDVKTRYKQTALGVAWALIQPLLTMLVFWVVFSQVARVPSNGLPYPLFAFLGLLPWTYFSQAVVRSSGGLVGNANLIGKVYFPRLIIPLSAALTPLVDFMLSLVVLVGMMVWYRMAPPVTIVALPAFMFIAFLTALGIGLWLSALHVKYRDVGHLVPFLVQIWMYASPVIYPLSMIPERWRPLYGLNPLVCVIEGSRWALTGGALPDMRAAALSFVGVIVVLVSGLVYFRRTEREFADII